jgi:hypothetical protein
MANTLLRSGDIKDFKMLGHDGKAAYLVASQIREMFRVKLGRQYADCLAIPQRNDQGNIVDWYIPFDSDLPDGQYDIIPWTSASEAEQKSALVLLKEFENKVIDLGQRLASNPNLEGDQLLFSRLIYDPKQSSDRLEPNLMAIRFPSNQFVYIVNGKPVITFWGFVDSQTPQATSPFYCLEAFRHVEPAVTLTEPCVAVSRPWWKRWWLWLLGLLPLLLLLLAIFWLRGCWLSPSLPVKPNLSLDHNVGLPAVVNDKEDKKDPELEANGIVNNKPVNVLNGHLPHGSIAVDPNAAAVNAASSDSAVVDNSGVSSITPDEGVLNNENPDGTAAQPQTEPQSTPPEANNPDEKGNNVDKDDKGDNSDKGDQGATPNPSDDKKDNQDGQNNDDKNTQASQVPSTPDLNSTPDAMNSNADQSSTSNSNANQSKNLALPADALKQGSTDFLNGQWSAGGGIQDKATGKPLQLSYNFNKGDGEVTVTRSDGVKCVGKVGSGINNANLKIAGNTEAICSDNTKYKLPNIQCKPGKNNQADCQGIYNNGISFPITMKKQ